jgi:hypothetical protein
LDATFSEERPMDTALIQSLDPAPATRELGARLYATIVQGAAAQGWLPTGRLYRDADGRRCHVGHLLDEATADRFDVEGVEMAYHGERILRAVLEEQGEELPMFAEDRAWLVALLRALESSHNIAADYQDPVEAAALVRLGLVDVAEAFGIPRPAVLA